jgi:hypothetical protein
MTRHMTLLVCLAAPAMACAPVKTEPDAPPDASTGAPIDAPTDASTSQSIALKALQFTGTQSARTQVVVSTATSDITLEAWVRWDGGTTLQGVAYNGNSSSSGYGLYVENGIPRVLVAGKGFVTCTGCVLTPRSWSHIVAVRSGGVWTIYRDGVAGMLSGTLTLAPATPLGTFSVGRSPSGGESFNGAIDEVRAWNVARTVQELARDRTAALTGNEAGLVAYYRLDEGSGDLSRDATSNHHDLSLYGHPIWIDSSAMLTTNTRRGDRASGGAR